MKLFPERYGKHIAGVPGGWERLAFRGTLRSGAEVI